MSSKEIGGNLPENAIIKLFCSLQLLSLFIIFKKVDKSNLIYSK